MDDQIYNQSVLHAVSAECRPPYEQLYYGPQRCPLLNIIAYTCTPQRCRFTVKSGAVDTLLYFVQLGLDSDPATDDFVCRLYDSGPSCDQKESPFSPTSAGMVASMRLLKLLHSDDELVQQRVSPTIPSVIKLLVKCILVSSSALLDSTIQGGNGTTQDTPHERGP